MYDTGMDSAESTPCMLRTESFSTTLEVREDGNRVHESRLQVYEQFNANEKIAT